ncbi:MAG: tripartite tricarboxylate transporter TctB family protein [Eubacteriales bacterium]|jgi:putative tricarboxylic transport membrane protein
MTKYKDIIAAIILLLVTAWYFSGTFMDLKFALSDYGAEFVPRIYCICMLLVCIGILIKSILQCKKQAGSQNASASSFALTAAGKRVLLTIAVIIVYIALMEPLGFLGSSILYLFVQTWILAPVEKRKPVAFLVFAILGAVFLDYVFVKFFYLSLPAGILGF